MEHQHLAYTWNFGYVALSYVIASLAAFVSLELAGRATGAEKTTRRFWIVAQGLLLGYGIWAMHFIGMLAYEVNSSVSYNMPITVASGVAAVAFLTAALFILDAGRPTIGRILTGGVVAGTGIVVMHYAGMAAMTTGGTPAYQPIPFALSVLIAVSAASVALFLFSQVRGEAAARLSRPVLYGIKAAAALVMGVAIVGMHYTGMAAVKFDVAENAVATSALSGTDTSMLGMIVLIITFVVLGLAVASIAMDSSDNELAQDF